MDEANRRPFRLHDREPRLLLESAVLGVLGALSAQAFLWLLHWSDRLFLGRMAGYQPPETEFGSLHQVIGPHGLWLIPAVTTLGGLISGFLVYRYAPEAEGHGTDTAVDAFHRREGIIRPRVPPLKMLASAITIGSGGSAGREGPIALITAGVGSVYARLAHRSEEDRRLLLLAGMAAGLSAIFRTPMGTGVFAIEVLYGKMEFEVGALLYTMLASAVAYTVNGLFVGFEPLFRVPAIPTPRVEDFGAFAALGVAAGLVGTILPVVFYRTRDAFRKLPIPLWMKPGAGGLLLGLLALKLPQVLGGGYGWIQLAIDGRLALDLMVVLIFAKIVALALTVSSGGSGGVFAPSLYVGAMLGGTFAVLLHEPAAVFVVVGMAAVFGGAARVPIATMLMVTEMAGGYHLLVPAGLAVMVAYLLQVRLSRRLRYRSLYEGQVPTQRDSPAHYMEHIQIALNLLGRRNLPMADKLGHLDLLRMLRSRVRFDLPGGRELTMGVVRDDSPIAGRTVGELYEQLWQYDFEIVTIRRREHLILPHSETVLETGDRMALITSPGSREPLAQVIAPLPEEHEGGVQAEASEPGRKGAS
ncbi:MAG TPA: chloride channel protein [Acidobacteriaceae bacterium]|nr:chloride channel protein [Acidobacteriaceae bacterium]